jgi:NhaP-type Na+/H+ or K+/H+ antiporter
MAWMPGISRRTGISYSIIYVAAGAAIYGLFPGKFPTPLPGVNEGITVRLTEMVIIISLMGTGIRIDRRFSFKNWAAPLRLISIAMLLCISAAALLGYSFLGLDLASAVLLGAVLAPTDPVLASDVQVGPPNEKRKFETKFALTAEAGLNDGMAFPFTWLAIALALMAGGEGGSLTEWFAYDFLYKIIAGIAMGWAVGKLVGYLVLTVSDKYKLLKTGDGLLAPSLTLLVYGLTELIHGYGFVAVFVTAVTFRHFEKEQEYHSELHSFTEQLERTLVAIMLLIFGGALVSGILAPLSWPMAIFSLAFLLVIRPVAAYLSLFKTGILPKEKLAISFFGIRGLGSIFYLAFALRKASFNFKDELWAIVAFCILVSIIIHGFTATPIMNRLKKSLPEEKIPE